MFISPGVATRGLTGVQCGIRNDHNVVCARMRCSVTTISRERNRLWPSGLQYNARRKQFAWTSSSLCTGILAGRCSAICRRQLTNTKRKITIDWCPDHVVCRTRSAHAVTPSVMLFSEQKSQEFCGPYLDIGPPTSFQAAASGRRTWLSSTDTGTAEQHRDVRGGLGHTTFETVRWSLTRRAADEGRRATNSVASVRAVAAARLRTRALGDALEVNGGARSRALGCASTAAHVAWPRRVGPATAAAISHTWRDVAAPRVARRPLPLAQVFDRVRGSGSRGQVANFRVF